VSLNQSLSLRLRSRRVRRLNAPANLRVVSNVGATVDLAWDDTNADELDYEWGVAFTGSDPIDSGSVPANTTTYELTGLDPGTDFTFTVYAKAAEGSGFLDSLPVSIDFTTSA
jgi:hypothetical protein